MPKSISFRQGVGSVLFWSVIAAAFIGPGTVTTAASAGAGFGFDLLWALVFSIFATIFLQEAAGRITIASGKNLGQIIALRFASSSGRRLKLLLFLAVAFGCAAYQAGNLLGALSGLTLFTLFPSWAMTLLLGVVCASLLWIGNFKQISNLLGLIVALMGVAFVIVFTKIGYDELPALSSVPPMPSDAGLLIIGLIGTTIVPYNLFLASGISPGQSLPEMRWGVTIAVVIGGLISIAIMGVGTQVAGEFSFEALAGAMSTRLGEWAVGFFGFGLFAAGLSSSVTAPLAAAVTASSLFGGNEKDWSPASGNFRLVWGTVLGIGLLFGIIGVKPIPAIILAQAINGILLPVVAIFLIIAVNDVELLGKEHINSRFSNSMLLLIVGVACFLGLVNLWKAFDNILPLEQITLMTRFWVNLAIVLLLEIILVKKIWR